MQKIILAFLCVWLALSTYAEATGLTTSNPQTDGNGAIWYDATSSYNGPGSTILRILSPTNPAPGIPHRFIYVLPVIPGVDLQDEFGDGFEELLALNVHNDYNAHIIAPSFHADPWYADHASNPDRQYESFMVRDLVPWVQANLSVTGQEEHWLIGFSKSGFGAVTLLFRNPTVFDVAAAWDWPADQVDAFDWGMLDNYGTDANFQNNYRLTEGWIAAHKEPFQTSMRLWLSADYVTYYGIPTFRDEVLAFTDLLEANGVQYMLTGGATRVHSWTSGWLLEAVADLHEGPPPPPPHASSAGDDFNRANGSLGPDWRMDPAWGTGISITGNAVVSPLGNGGAYYWDANVFGADQYSQVTLTGVIGDWTGVVVRGEVSSAQGYWAAVKADGVYLYALVNGVFYLLADDATVWATGDVLRLAVQTIAANMARLTVSRNGSVLFTYDDADHFIASGQPGIGLYATTAVALDDWAGGELTASPPPPPTDTAPPVRLDGAPTGVIAMGTTQVTLSLVTDETATCRYTTTAGVAYGTMTNTFTTTGGTAHATTVAGLSNGESYTYFVRCQDGTGNANTNDFPISFSVAAAHVSSASDDFNRANGSLGPDWRMDPAWGNGTAIGGNAVMSPLGNGGAYYWDANGFGADQYSQVTLTGSIGDWAGVVVRGGASPAQGYWAAVKADGVYLYSFVNGVFYLLAQNATPWATGDVLRLAVQTVAANTARLTVYRNGSALFTYDDADNFIASGQPGIGLHATVAVALDDWAGGELTASLPPPDTTGPSVAISSHTNNQTVTTSTITVAGTASDSGVGNSGISSVTVNGVAATGGTATGALTATWSQAVTLNLGANTITVVAKDASPTLNSSTVSITVNYSVPDTTGPSVAITSHTNNQTVTMSTITVAGTASDSGVGNSGISSVTVNGVAATGGTATGALTATWSQAVTLNPGANTITVVAKDASPTLNSSTVSITVNYSVPDTTGPSVAITSHTDNQTVTTSTITVAGTASDSGVGNSGISSVMVNGVAATGGTATGALTATWSQAVTLNRGANTITVVAKDASPTLNSSTVSITMNYQAVTAFPNTTTVLPGSGTLSSGAAAALTSDNNVYYAVNSTTTGTRTAAWYGSFPGVSKSLSKLRVNYKGNNSRNCTQTVAIWRWTTSAWVQLDSRTVGTTEVAINNLAPRGTLANYVSGTSGSGDLRVRIQCQTTANFTNRGDVMSIVYDMP